MAAVTTTKTALTKLFKALNCDTADEWDIKKLQTRAEGGLTKYLEPGQVLAEDDKKLFDAIEAANKEQDDIKVTDDTTPPVAKKPAGKKPAAGPTPATPAKKPAATPAKPATAKGAAAPATTKKPAAKRTGGWKPGDPPLPFDESRGPGVIRTLVDHLKGASSEKPLTKADAVAKLKAAFPDRDTDKLTTTVNNQIPSRLRIVRGIHVWSNAKGYWIEGDGKKPQTDRVRPSTSPKETEVKGNKSATQKTSPAAKPTGKPAAKPAAGPAKKGPAGKVGKAADAKKTVAGKAAAKASAGKK